MDTDSATFLRFYNELDSLLARHYGDYDRNHSVIARYASELSRSASFSVSLRGKKLDEARAIRNTLVHDLDMNENRFISVSPTLLTFLQEEIARLSSPKTASSISTPISRLINARLEDKVGVLFSTMAEKGYMQRPVLSASKRLLGVLSPNAMLVYLIRHDYSSTLTLQEMEEELKIENHICECYAFLPRNASIEEVEAIYNEHYLKGKKLAMVFLTESGKKEEAILGIITPHDIVYGLGS